MKGVFGSGAPGCYPDATVEGLYTVEAGQTATGSILDWYRRHFAGTQQGEADRRGVNVYTVLDELAAGVAAGAGRARRSRRLARQPLALQESDGSRRDHGVVAGARPRPSVPRLVRSDRVRHAPHPRRRRRRTACGSTACSSAAGAKSPVWLQIHADVLKKPIFLTRETEAVRLGAALAASLAAGIYPDFDAAARAMVHLERTVAPNPANRRSMTRCSRVTPRSTTPSTGPRERFPVRAQ